MNLFNWLAPYWKEIFEKYPHGLILTLGTFLLHEVVYFGRYIPYLICDHIPFLRRYKIQQDKENTWKDFWICFRKLMISHILVQLPLMLGYHPLVNLLGMQPPAAPFPTCITMAIQISIFMVIEDFYEYWLHRWLHYGILYRLIHKTHHEFSAPFGITAEYAHPAETLILGVGTMLGPILLAHHLHVITLWSWVIVRLLQTVDAHSGYDFPWSLHHWLPFWAGADFHDYHHMNFVGNYATSFRWCDYLFSTDLKYKKWREKQSLLKDN
jgi:methylsterol monooxygenase